MGFTIISDYGPVCCTVLRVIFCNNLEHFALLRTFLLLTWAASCRHVHFFSCSIPWLSLRWLRYSATLHCCDCTGLGFLLRLWFQVLFIAVPHLVNCALR